MPKDLYQLARDDLDRAIDLGVERKVLPSDLDRSKIVVGPTRDPKHGDVANNAPFILAPQLHRKPNEIAELLAPLIVETASIVDDIKPAGGFINASFRIESLREELRTILRAGLSYGDCDLGRGEPVNVEYVSANPTGPLHVGHGRGAVFGDALANLLAKSGFQVTREYYINDAGAQIEALGRTNEYNVRKLRGEKVGDPPEGYYPGEYMQEVAAVTASQTHLLIDISKVARDIAVDENLKTIQSDLAALGISFDAFTSERTLVVAGKIDEAVRVLESRDLVYTGTLERPKGKPPEDWEPRPQLLFRATRFGDEVDRPLKKSDGSWTYFASDIAYHLDKYSRGFARMIDVWGADHGGYVKRVQAAVTALTEGKGALEVKVCQLVHLLKGGQPYKMSKRAGNFVTLREVVDEVGKDVVRFIMLTRKNDAQLEFDLDKVVEQSRDNPVFYVQYAHARARSVLRHAADMFPNADFSPAALAGVNLARLTDAAELALIRQMAGWPRLVEGAAEAREPHRIAFYLYDLAAQFHALWNMGKDDSSLRFLVEADAELSVARAALVQGVAQVVASGLAVFGVEAVEEMH